jgi:hypothetical protein
LSLSPFLRKEPGPTEKPLFTLNLSVGTVSIGGIGIGLDRLSVTGSVVIGGFVPVRDSDERLYLNYAGTFEEYCFTRFNFLRLETRRTGARCLRSTTRGKRSRYYPLPNPGAGDYGYSNRSNRETVGRKPWKEPGEKFPPPRSLTTYWKK